MANNPGIKIDVKNLGAITTIALDGRLTLGAASQDVRNAIEQVFDGGVSKVVINLHGLTFLDSAGLGSLAVGAAKARAAGASIRLADAQPRVKDALELTCLTRVLPLFPTLDEAFASFTNEESVAPTQ